MATVLKIFKTVAFLLCKILSKISHIIFFEKDKRIRRININRKIRRLGKHLNHLQLLYIRVQQLKASFMRA